MMAPVTPTERHPVEQLAEDYLIRLRRGDKPSLNEYVQQFPDVADELADIIQALLMLEGLGADGQLSEDSTVQTPETLGEYRLVREVGRGGMGIVYEAEQPELGRRVALKVLPAAALLRPTQLERFRREARAAARMHHTNIIPVYGVGAQDGVHYYAMQYISGRGLDAIIDELHQYRTSPNKDTAKDVATLLSGTALSGESDDFRSIARVGMQVADALAHAHGHGVLHRDVKPANILLDDQGVAWLGDFGLAYLEGDSPLTSTGGFVGTLRYLAPERFKGDGDTRSDVYSLGATLYELLTLRPMFDETDRARLVRQVTQDEPTLPRQINRTIPRDLETIVLKATSKSPRDRYATSAEMAEDIRRFLADRPLKARRVTRSELFRRWIRRNPIMFGLLTTTVVSLAVGLGATLWQWKQAKSNLADKVAALEHAEKSEREAKEQSQLAKAHGHRAYQMLADLLSELNSTPEQRPIGEARRRLMEQAIRVHQKLIDATPVGPEERLDVAKIAIEVGMSRSHIQQHVAAEGYFRRAIALVEPEASDPTSDSEIRLTKARALSLCANALCDQGRRDDAEPIAEQGITLFRSLFATQPANKRFGRGLAGALTTRGILATDKGQSDHAIANYVEAVKVVDQLLANSDDTSTQQNRITHLIHLATEYRRAFRWEEARATAELALKSAERLETRNPRSVVNQEHLTDAAFVLGTTLLKQAAHIEPDSDSDSVSRLCGEAETYIRRALTSGQRLVDNNRTELDYRHKLAAALSSLAMALTGQGRTDEAVQFIEKAMKEDKELLRVAPKNWRYLLGHIYSHRVLGMTYCRTGNHAKAAAVVATMTAIRTSRGAECFSAAELLRCCSKTALQDSNLSAEQKAKVAQQYDQQALDLLKQAVERGFVDRKGLEDSSWLRGLQDRAEFRQIMDQLHSKSKTDNVVID